MGHLYLEHCLKNQSASKVAGSGNAPAGLSPVRQPWGRFLFGEDAMKNKKIEEKAGAKNRKRERAMHNRNIASLKYLAKKVLGTDFDAANVDLRFIALGYGNLIREHYQK
jgi:hypothetical protein